MSRNEDSMTTESATTSSDAPSERTSSRRATHPVQDLALPLLDAENNSLKTRRRACVTEEEVTPQRVFFSPPPTRIAKVPLKRCLKLPEDQGKFSPTGAKHPFVEDPAHMQDPLYWSSGSGEATTCPASMRLSDDNTSDKMVPDLCVARMISDQSHTARSTVQVTEDGNHEGRRTVTSFDICRRITFGRSSKISNSFEEDTYSTLATRRHSFNGDRYDADADDDYSPDRGQVISVINCSQEWDAFGSSDSSDNGEKNGSNLSRYKRKGRRQTTFQKSIAGRRTWLETFATDYASVLMRNMQRVRCLWFSTLYVADFVFKYTFLVFLRYSWRPSRHAHKPSFDMAWYSHYRTIFWVLLPFQLLTTILCIGLALADDSLTRLRKRGGSRWMLRVKGILVVVFLGLFQLISVKKAYSKYRAQVPTIILEVEAKKQRRRSVDTRWEGFLGRQGTVRMNLNILTITGVPYVLCLMHVLGIEWSTCPSSFDRNANPYIHDFYMFVAFGVLVFLCSTVQGIVDIDVCVSWYVKAHTLFECGRQGGRVEGKQIIYPIAHWLFRISEITWRAIALVGLSWLCLALQVRSGNNDWLLKFAIVILLCFDFSIGAILLARYSPSRIQSPKCIVLYLVCSFLMVVANIVHFVDRAGFAVPAMRISRIINVWRFCLFVAMSIWLLVYQFSEKGDYWTHLPHLTTYSVLFFVPGTLYWFLFLTFFRESGYDMHTLARQGDASTLETVLGEDNSPFTKPLIDSRTMDGRFDTALHLAARAKHRATLETLINHKADVNLPNWNGNTPFHVACRQPSYFRYLWDRIMRPSSPRIDDKQKDIITLLLDASADPFVRNFANQRPIDVVDENLRCLLERRRITVATDSTRRTTASTRRRTTACGTTGLLNHRVVRDCSPDDLDKIFPHLHDRWVDEAYNCPPPARRNIATLIFHEGGAGYFDLEFLACGSQRLVDKDLLLRLRTVETIGQGGFGEVVKVEDTSWPGTFYAMKIQKRDKWKQAFVECEALQCVEHPHIVTLLAAFQTPTYYALLLEYCCTDMNMKVLAVENEFGRCIGLPREQALRYGSHILLAMAHLHGMNFAYRDLKPQNVLLDETDNVKLADFGLAKGVPEDSGGVVRASIHHTGTYGFMPPELFGATGEAGSSCSDLFAVDMFAFGMTLIIMLCGENVAEKRLPNRPRSTHIFVPCHPKTTVDRLRDCTIFDSDEEYQNSFDFYESTNDPSSPSDSSSFCLDQRDANPDLQRPQNPQLNVAMFALLVSMICKDPACRPQTHALLQHEMFEGECAREMPAARSTCNFGWEDEHVDVHHTQQEYENENASVPDLELGNSCGDPLMVKLDV